DRPAASESVRSRRRVRRSVPDRCGEPDDPAPRAAARGAGSDRSDGGNQADGRPGRRASAFVIRPRGAMSLQSLKSFVRFTLWRTRTALGLVDSNREIESDAQRYWAGRSNHNWEGNSHWRGGGIFKNDDARWLAIGQQHFDLYEMFARAIAF